MTHMKALLLFTILVSQNYLGAVESNLYYASDDKNLLETKALVEFDKIPIICSVRLYNGFKIQRAFVMRFEDAYSVQLIGLLLEKDWPRLPIILKIGDCWRTGVRKTGIGEGANELIIYGLSKKEAMILVKDIPFLEDKHD
jgi:hypothetical protein